VDIIAVLGLAACLVVIVALVFLHVAKTGLSPITDPVSAYGLTRARAGYAVAAIAAAVCGGCCAIVLSREDGTGAAVVLLWAFALARVLIPFFPMDRAGESATLPGRVHNLLAVAAFATVTASAFLAVGPLAAAGRGASATATLVAAIIMAIGSVGVIAAVRVPALRRVFGATERLIYLGFIVWFLVLTLGAIVR
jgi:hypothetical protein